MFRLINHFEKEPVPRVYRPPLATNFNPQAWASVQMSGLTGPYAYALNLPQIGECLAGNLMMKPDTEKLVGRNGKRAPTTPEELEKKLRLDRLHYLGDALPSQGHVIAFFLKAETSTRPSELICARRDSNNLWSCRIPSRKGGCNKPYQPSQKDFSGKPMVDILKADFGTQTTFLGYGSAPYAGTSYYPRLAIPQDYMRPFNRSLPAEVKLAQR